MERYTIESRFGGHGLDVRTFVSIVSVCGAGCCRVRFVGAQIYQPSNHISTSKNTYTHTMPQAINYRIPNTCLLLVRQIRDLLQRRNGKMEIELEFAEPHWWWGLSSELMEKLNEVEDLITTAE